MKLSIFATLTLLLALPACTDEKSDTDSATETATVATTDDKTTGETTAEGTTAEGTTAASEAMTSTTTTGEPTTGEPTGGTMGLSFADDIWTPILLPSCDCHQAGPSGGLLMGKDADTAYAAMVNIASSNSMNYVTPNDPDNSYMLHKVSGTQVEAGGGGSKMPLGGTPLTAEQLGAIEDWILDGAGK